MSAPVPAGWYPDPSGAAATVRWWDGAAWTEHTQQAAPAAAEPQWSAGGQQAAPSWQAAQSQQAGQFEQAAPYGQQPYPQGGYRSPMTEPVLFVSQKRKIIELTNEYAIYGQDGAQIGGVTEVGQSTAKKALRFLTDFDQFLTHRLEVHDTNGRPLLQLTRPAKVLKSTLIVQGADGVELGRLVQRNVFGKIRFGMEANGVELGSLNAENWRAWNFSIQDVTGAEVARITKTWEGLLTTLFTTADTYQVQIHRPLQEPLLSLVVASALTVDTALKQDSRGLG